MKLLKIKECGSNNTLMWAIKNGADPCSMNGLLNIINDELSYQVDIGDVNAFELFRLCQTYRDELRILNFTKACVPEKKELDSIFIGSQVSNDGSEKISLSDVAGSSMEKWMNIVLQMKADDDIIDPMIANMFIPMLSRKYDIQIPVAFIDVFESIIDEDKKRNIFSREYPSTIDSIVDDETCGFHMYLMLGLIQRTSPIYYSADYEKYLKYTKYFAITKKRNPNKPYQIALNKINRYNTIGRCKVSCNLFKSNPAAIKEQLKKLSALSTPIQFEFSIQLPIYCMQILLNSLTKDEMDVKFESSINEILENRFVKESFITDNYNDDGENGSMEQSIGSYKVRLSEANNNLMNTLNLLTSVDTDINPSSIYALLPSAYNTNAVITIGSDAIAKLSNHYNKIISAMGDEMYKISSSIKSDINSLK